MMTPDDFKKLIESLQNNSTPETLDLGKVGKRISRERFPEFCKALAANKSLVNLSLANHHIGAVNDGSTKHLAEALESNCTLRKLDLTNNGTDHTTLLPIANALKVKNRTVTDLNLSKNNLVYDGNGHYQGVKPLTDILQSNHTLQSLNLKQSALDDECAKELAIVLQAGCTLQDLDLEFTPLGDSGIECIASALKTNSNLRRLNIGHTYFGKDGAKHLSDALKENKGLQELHLHDNDHLYSAAIPLLVEFLKTNKTLKVLNLSNIDGLKPGLRAVPPGSRELTSIEYLTSALKENQTLQELNLCFNEINVFGASSIAEVLKTNRSLTRLNCSMNCFGDEGAKHLAIALHENRTLQHLDLRSNRFTENNPHQNEIQNLLTRNCEIVFLMGLHPRLGHDSSIKQHLLTNSAFDRQVLREVFAFFTVEKTKNKEKDTKEDDEPNETQENGTALSENFGLETKDIKDKKPIISFTQGGEIRGIEGLDVAGDSRALAVSSMPLNHPNTPQSSNGTSYVEVKRNAEENAQTPMLPQFKMQEGHRAQETLAQSQPSLLNEEDQLLQRAIELSLESQGKKKIAHTRTY